MQNLIACIWLQLVTYLFVSVLLMANMFSPVWPGQDSRHLPQKCDGAQCRQAGDHPLTGVSKSKCPNQTTLHYLAPNFNLRACAGVPGPCPGHIWAADVRGVHGPQDPCQLSSSHRMQESSGTVKGVQANIVVHYPRNELKFVWRLPFT